MKKQKEQPKEEGVSFFEEKLLFTSLRYCIGRHSYIVSMAGDIGKNYYNNLSSAQKETLSKDIRSEIKRNLEMMPYNFVYEGVYGVDIKPIEDFVNACEYCNITSFEELSKRKKIVCYYDYDQKMKKYEDFITERGGKYQYWLDIDDLLPFENLASLFDEENHVIVTANDGQEYECFEGYKRKIVEDGEKKGWYRMAPFGWEKVYITVSSYLNNGDNASYILPNCVEKVEKKNNKEK